jgi:hypothetical protein
MTLSFWISSGGSSCVLFREPKRRWGAVGEDFPGEGSNCGYALGINYRDRDYPTGSLCKVQKARKVVGKEEEWNDLEILCRGTEVRAMIGGQTVTRFNQLRAQPGVIGFESPETAPDGFEVRFRDVVITPLA